MKGKQLRKAVLLGMAMSMAVWTTGMAAPELVPTEDVYNAEKYYIDKQEGTDGYVLVDKDGYDKTITGSFVSPGEKEAVVIEKGPLTIKNSKESEASIYLTDDMGRDVKISTVGGHIINSAGSGIRTQNTIDADDTHTISLTASGKGGNFIYFNQGDSEGGNGITVEDHADIQLNAENGINTITDQDIASDMLTAKENQEDGGDGINLAEGNSGKVLLDGKRNLIYVTSDGIYTAQNNENIADDSDTYAVKLQATEGNTIQSGNNGIDHHNNRNVMIDATGSNSFTTGGDGVRIQGNGTISVTGGKNTINAGDDGVNMHSDSTDGKVTITANEGGNSISGVNKGLHVEAGALTVTANNSSNTITGSTAVYLKGSGHVRIQATATNRNGISLLDDVSDLDNNLVGENVGVDAATEQDEDGNGVINIIADNDNIIAGSQAGILIEQEYNSKVNVMAGNENIIGKSAQYTDETGQEHTINDSEIGINAQNGMVDVTAKSKNTVVGTQTAISAGFVNETDEISTAGKVTLSAGSNYIAANQQTFDSEDFGSGAAIYSIGGSKVAVTTSLPSGENWIYGSVYAAGHNTDEDDSVSITGGQNVIRAAAVIDGAGDLNASEDTDMNQKKVVSALYAEDSAKISLSGINYIYTYADKDNKDNTGIDGTLERAVWAYDKADIEIEGSTYIGTDHYEQSANSDDIAIAAGTATNLTKENVFNMPADTDLATVTLRYGAGSKIQGDILAAYAGKVTIDAQEKEKGFIKIEGNLLAGNNGVLNVNLGNGGTLTGRADDYGDAGFDKDVAYDEGHANSEFFNPAFSSTIFKGGEVNLSMGEGSTWNVTGQSWITSINTENAAKADTVWEESSIEGMQAAMKKMANINFGNIQDIQSGEQEGTFHALTIGEMKGDAVFTMNLQSNRGDSDMLYMKHAEGNYIINVVDPVTVKEMYFDNGKYFDGLRFATIGEGSNVTFRAVTIGQGALNIEYEVDTDEYAGNKENDAYNGDGLTAAKPGTGLVDKIFNSDEEAETIASENEIALLSSSKADVLDADNGSNEQDNSSQILNHKIVAKAGASLSNAGKTIIDMSKVNYSNAIYMDRLNKRMGEARYIDGDEGLWVRMRHDRIGKSDAFRSKNTMMELGYDKRVDDREDGEHRRGFAIDYMRGTAEYHNVAGDGDVRRGGVWFYDTWLGNKGHYSDYVLKFGRLSNDFDIYSELGEKIHGDYSNFVYSASAEYGRKKDIGKDWYFEPQVQLQYAHVTDADYTTSQDTQVQLDAIDSLIGRVGFRLGKDVGEKSTFYIKADVLHEFLGDQDIEARDATGLLSTTYENEGTWYDIGLGFSHQFSKGTYMYLDMEKSIGNDNEDTYQFNFGMNWKV